MIRCFIAIPLDEAMQTALGRAIEKLRPAQAKVTWVKPSMTHLTLKFLGDVEDRRIPAITQALDEVAAGVEPFAFTLTGLGSFPPGGRPSVIWAGLAESCPPLSHLHGRMEACLVEQDFPKDKRQFTPHVTIGRVRGAKQIQALTDAIVRQADAGFGTQPVDCVRLMMSTLGKHGAEHTVMSTHPLLGDGPTE